MGEKLTKLVNSATFADYGDGTTDKIILQELFQNCGDSNEARFAAVDEYVSTSSVFDDCLVKNKITWPKNYSIFEGTAGIDGKPFFETLTEEQAKAFYGQLKVVMTSSQ